MEKTNGCSRCKKIGDIGAVIFGISLFSLLPTFIACLISLSTLLGKITFNEYMPFVLLIVAITTTIFGHWLMED
jgi:hypothetical protein